MLPDPTRVAKILPLIVGAVIFSACASAAPSAASTPTLSPTATAAPTQAPPTATPTPAPPTATATPAMEEVEPGLLRLASLDQLRDLFNAGAGSPRLILTLSPGCPSCMEGAHWVYDNILAANPDLDLDVYAIWFPSVDDNLLPFDQNEYWDANPPDDPRVVNLWDGDLVAVTWLAEHEQYEGNPTRNSFEQGFGDLAWGEVVWDTYFLYGPDSTWASESEAPTERIDARYPILQSRNVLRDAVGAIPAALPESAAATYGIVQSESVVSYGVQEQFLGSDANYAMGVTSEIEGEITVNTQDPSQSQVGTITVDIEAFQSDNILRDERIRQEFLQSSRYPIAAFTPTELVGLPTTPYDPGEVLEFDIVGDLTVREITVPVTFHVQARIDGGRLMGTATAQILMTDFGFDPPRIGDLIATENEVDLMFEFVAEPVE